MPKKARKLRIVAMQVRVGQVHGFLEDGDLRRFGDSTEFSIVASLSREFIKAIPI
jgi:hypothetical protein